MRLKKHNENYTAVAQLNNSLMSKSLTHISNYYNSDSLYMLMHKCRIDECQV